MLEFRKATIKDSKAIAELHARSWQQNYRGAFSDEYLDNLAREDRIKVWSERLNNPKANQQVLLAIHQSSLVGFICAYFDDSEKYGTLVDNLHVSSELKGMGVGSQLIAMIAKEIKVNHTDSGMYLWVLEQNTAAHHFYKSLGGEVVETIPGNDIGDRQIIKTRYHWSSVQPLLDRVKSKSLKS
ncbi:GNAT family N-acetyltransferase [Pseudozobellia sp. WGM2]|uniref:GNAT family N-acetyltransferase n=1 Tax=Pseudozobellia sp. WGM2 TaxID=2787625 RepID=UPI001ADFA703|nr:GNAT family N-acetyltransferase [Pseudozobellia sp. WGM2]